MLILTSLSTLNPEWQATPSPTVPGPVPLSASVPAKRRNLPPWYATSCPTN